MKLKYTGKKLHLIAKDQNNEEICQVSFVDVYAKNSRIDVIARAAEALIREASILGKHIVKVESGETKHEEFVEFDKEQTKHFKERYLRDGYEEVCDCGGCVQNETEVPREDLEPPKLVYLSEGWEHDKKGLTT
jgi:hypothetical protein